MNTATKRDPNRRPTHPGEILREDVLPALNMSQTEFAKLLDVSRVTVSELLLEKRALTADMAVRIATLLKTTPESWLRRYAVAARMSETCSAFASPPSQLWDARLSEP